MTMYLKTNKLFIDFKRFGIIKLDEYTIIELKQMCNDADIVYYSGNSIQNLTDIEYDILKEYTIKKFPSLKLNEKIGSPVEKNVRQKVLLPYEMTSMDKIKPDTDALTLWCKKFTGQYVISCKLDGVSGMYACIDGKEKLYTRGDGKIGQDISHLIPYLNICKKGIDLGVRGEFIITKKIFKEKYKDKFQNIRNFVAGMVNRLTIIESELMDLSFVCYEVILPILKPSDQFIFLEHNSFNTVMHSSSIIISNDILSNLLELWREQYIYEIDGIIVGSDKIYQRVGGNPVHSFAFKMVLTDQMAEAKVLGVIWSASKDGYLKPRVQIEPIIIGGVNIEYATGFNASFIFENNIGIGSVIKLIRSGDVIPHIDSIIIPALNPMMPVEGSYVWNDTHIDIILKDFENDITVREKLITRFFQGISVEGLSSGNISRLFSAGYNTIPLIIKMKKEDFLKIDGFKDKLSTKLYEGIKMSLMNASLVLLMSVSNIFGRGISEKKIEPIIKSFPDILTSNNSIDKKIEMVVGVKGMAIKSAETFVKNIPLFVNFIEEIGLSYKLYHVDIKSLYPPHILYNKNIVMTGFRDENISQFIKDMGANLTNSINKNTNLLIVKSIEIKTIKIQEAIRLNIPIISCQEFITKYL